MHEDLFQAVKAALVSSGLETQGFHIASSETFDSFDNAVVVLASPDLRIRITRERGQIFIDFGPRAESATWFDSDIVLEHLGLSRDQSFLASRASDAIVGVSAFIRRCGDEIREMFDDKHLATTKRDLRRLAEARAERLFGWKAHKYPGT